MYDIVDHTVGYFRTGRGSLWQWSADGDVAEFRSGGAITYREELVLLLQYFTDTGLPPLPAVLYILYACLDAPEGIAHTEPYRVLHQWPIAGPPVANLMKVIQGLPPEWRTGARKGLLLQEIFRDGKPILPVEHARAVLDEFRSGRLNTRVVGDQDALLTRADLDTKALRAAAERFPTTESLLLRLRTGLDVVPEEAPVAPELPADDLLRQLLNDPKTEGVARLTQRLVAALHITMHTDAVGDLPLGGYADISTRGALDRLLLSELAYDDAMLTARLVNNEALYLRREEPPDQVQRQRIILLDTTLPMWGLPRVFAVSAALASTRNLPPHTTAEVVALGGETHEVQNLSNRTGIVHALEQLDAALHCGAALENVLRRGGFDDDADYLLITDEETLQDPDFEARFRTTRERLQFLITVSRHGALHFYGMRNGRRKLLNSATYDLDELVVKRPKAARSVIAERPTDFFQMRQAPLYFPPVALPTTADMAYQTDTSVFCVTLTKRLLYWPDRRNGAIELLPWIAGDKYFFYTGEKGFLSLLALDTEDKRLSYYKIDLQHTTLSHLDLTLYFENQPILVHAGYMLFLGEQGLTGINCYLARGATDEEINAVLGLKSPQDRITFSSDPNHYLHRYQYKNERFSSDKMQRFTKVGTGTLQRIKKIAATERGYLLINKHVLLPTAEGTLVLRIAQPEHIGSYFRATPAEPCTMKENPRVTFYPFILSPHSRAYGDTRGLLHLESHQAEIPSVTIVLAVDTPLACWSSDGHTCGSSYFIRDENLTRLPAKIFYEKYVKRFIDDITLYNKSSL